MDSKKTTKQIILHDFPSIFYILFLLKIFAYIGTTSFIKFGTDHKVASIDL